MINGVVDGTGSNVEVDIYRPSNFRQPEGRKRTWATQYCILLHPAVFMQLHAKTIISVADIVPLCKQ